MHSKKIIGAIAFSAITAAALTACGGGGGSPGTTTERYVLDMEMEPSSVLYAYPATGYVRGVVEEDGRTHNNKSFWAAVTVHVRKGDGDLAPDGTSVSCHVDGLGVGGIVGTSSAAAKLQCDAPSVGVSWEHTTTVTTFAGWGRFFFHAGNEPTSATNQVRIVCRVIDPRDTRSHEVVQEVEILPFMKDWDEAVLTGREAEYAEMVNCTPPEPAASAASAASAP